MFFEKLYINTSDILRFSLHSRSVNLDDFNGKRSKSIRSTQEFTLNIFTSLYLFEASLQDQWRQIHKDTSIINAVWSKDWWRIFATSYCVKHCWKVLWCERKSSQYLCWNDSEKQKLVLICLRLSIVLDFFFSIIHERWIIMFEKTYWEKKK